MAEVSTISDMLIILCLLLCDNNKCLEYGIRIDAMITKTMVAS